MRVELNYMRALRHPCLVSDLQTRDVYPHGPAPAILSQPALPRLWPFGRGPPRDPQPQGAPLSLQALRGRTFSESRGTALYLVHKPKWLLEAEDAV